MKLQEQEKLNRQLKKTTPAVGESQTKTSHSIDLEGHQPGINGQMEKDQGGHSPPMSKAIFELEQR